MKRREFLRVCGRTSLLLTTNIFLAIPGSAKSSSGKSRIDRLALVRRHTVPVTGFDPCAAWSLGNGEFAFTADVTGLQTFAAHCAKSFPLCTTAHWAWHSFPLPANLAAASLRLKDYNCYGREVGYRTDSAGQEQLFNHLRQNPHRLHLGQIAFVLQKPDGLALAPDDLREISQTLDLWAGLLQSRFRLEDQLVEVLSAVHPELDLVAVRVHSPLLSTGRLRVEFSFPYGSPDVAMADWASTDRHSTSVGRPRNRRVDLQRRLDETGYFVAIEWAGPGSLTQTGPHNFELVSQSSELEFLCAFSARPIPKTLPNHGKTVRAATAHWRKYWTHGGAIDLSGSTDPRAETLERRTVLSQYQTAVHCAGSLPSAETGLLFNSWYGKFHLEMHWWHSVHFAAWNRFPLFERSLQIYPRILPLARELARSQGYRGARWPKMIGPDGHDSPSPVGPLLIWQQPHPIYYAELAYRERPGKQILNHWKEIVFDTAEFMASYAVFDAKSRRFVLGPPLKTVSENTDPLTAINPGFELSYWRFGLRVAQAWRERLGLARHPEWDRVLQNLAPLPAKDDAYLLQEGMSDTYTRWNWEHPALVGSYGMLPGDGVDPVIMRATVRKVMEAWQWERTWGWDFGLTAMAAARVGEPELAVRALLVGVPKNRYWPNGHNYQRLGLSAYLPGNGSLLCAMAMMAAGWTNGPTQHAPGFPGNGDWQVRWEDLKTWL